MRELGELLTSAAAGILVGALFTAPLRCEECTPNLSGEYADERCELAGGGTFCNNAFGFAPLPEAAGAFIGLLVAGIGFAILHFVDWRRSQEGQ